MPFYRYHRGATVPANSFDRGAFEVSEYVADEWRRLIREQNTNRPTRDGLRLRLYPAMDVAAHPPYADPGVYVDHRDPQVEQAAYLLRDRMLREQNGSPGQATLQRLAESFGLRHWRDAYNTVRNVGRRNTGEHGRDAATGELRWRAWNNTWSRQATEQADRAGTGFRHFGIEIEFDWSGTSYDLHDARTAIGVESRDAGLRFTDRWSNYGRNSTPGWQGTYDTTVGGGEVISDILVGDSASVNEAMDMIRRIKSHGGTATRRQGMHVHHDVRDFNREQKVRLVEGIEVTQDLWMAFVAPYRRTGPWSAAWSSQQFRTVRSAVDAGRTAPNTHSASAWNFGHLDGRGSIEFRALGYTLNTKNVRAWIRTGQAFMTAIKAGVDFEVELEGADNRTLDVFLDVLQRHGLHARTAETFRRRCVTQVPRFGQAAA